MIAIGDVLNRHVLCYVHVKTRQLRPIACVCRSPILQALFRDGRLGRGAGSPMVASLIVQPTSPPSDADAFTSSEHPLARSAYADLGPGSGPTEASGGLENGPSGPLASAAAATERADDEHPSSGDKEQTLPQTDESDVFMRCTSGAECASDSEREACENVELARPAVEHQSSCTAECALLEAALSCEEDTDTSARYETHPTHADAVDTASPRERSGCSETRGIGGESDPPPASAFCADYSRAIDSSASAWNAARPELHPFPTPTATKADVQKETEPCGTTDDVEAPREGKREAPDESMCAIIERNGGTEQRKRGDGIDGEDGIEGVFPGVGASAAAVEQLEEDSLASQMQNTPMSSQPLPVPMPPDSPSAPAAPSFPASTALPEAPTEAPAPPVDSAQCNEQPASPMSVDNASDKSPDNPPAPEPMEPTLTESPTAATSCAPPWSVDPEDQEEPAIAATATGTAEWAPHFIRSMSLRSENASDASARTEHVANVSEPVPLCSTAEPQPSLEPPVVPTDTARRPVLLVREEDEEEVESPAVLETQIQSRLALLRAADETAAEPTPDTCAGSLAAHLWETTFVASGGTAQEGLTPVTPRHEDDSEDYSIGEARGHSEQPVGFLSTTEEAEEAAKVREACRRESKLRALRTPDPHPHSDHNSFEDSDPGPVNDEDDLSNDDGDSL